jgi:hypothetical protein
LEPVKEVAILMDMDRNVDLAWFQENRARLSKEHPGRWLVVYGGELKKVLPTEESAIEFSVTEFGIEEASVFQATATDPFIYIGGAL